MGSGLVDLTAKRRARPLKYARNSAGGKKPSHPRWRGTSSPLPEFRKQEVPTS